MEDVQNGNDTDTICDDEPPERIYFTIPGLIIATLGCAGNTVLLYALIFKRSGQLSGYLIFLAILDLFLCAIYVSCFGFDMIAKMYEIKFLFDASKSVAVQQLVVSKIVQVCIPYVLIAISAERLGWIGGKSRTRGCVTSLIVCVSIALVWTLLRVPAFFSIKVMDVPECEYFKSKPIFSTDFASSYLNFYFEVFVSFFHLFVSFIVLCLLNGLIIYRLSVNHRNARRNSSCPNVVLSTSKQIAMSEERKEHKRLRCAIKTTTVVLSSYLACNSVNFTLYVFEQFLSNFLKDENGAFKFEYWAVSDIGTILFVLSSTSRVFIYYKYNTDVKAALRTIWCFNCCHFAKKTTSTYECAPIEMEMPGGPSHV